MRWLGFAVFSVAPLFSTASSCPDPNLRQATIGGDAIIGFTSTLHAGPLTSARVRLYSSDGIFVWGGITDNNGDFEIHSLQVGEYHLKVSGWGSATVKLVPELGKVGSQKSFWSISLADKGCIITVMKED